MCRILSICGKIEYNKSIEILEEFQHLAEYGKVPRGVSNGHKDGWGIIAYENNRSNLFVKSFKNAYKDFKYSETIKELKDNKNNIIIAHLRKASVGVKNINNAHPFMYKNYSFCQNGTVFGIEKIFLEPKFENIIKGTTDSERLFAYILQFLSKYKKPTSLAIKNSIEKAVKYIKNNFDFTAMNIIFSDGKHIWSLREVNEKNVNFKKKNLLDYYSLFIGSSYGYKIISSEKMPLNNVKWKKIRNHKLIQINTK